MTAMTVFSVPHMALGAELSPGAHTRTRLFGFRQAIATFGSALALVLGTTLLTRSDAPRDTRSGSTR